MATINPFGYDATTGRPRKYETGDTLNGVPSSTVTQTITNGVTTTSPSEDAVYDALALKLSAPSGFKIQVGSDSNNFSGSSDTTVTFPTAFSSAPKVFLQINTNSGSNGAMAMIASISTTGFTYYGTAANNTRLNSGNNYILQWMAIGT